MLNLIIASLHEDGWVEVGQAAVSHSTMYGVVYLTHGTHCEGGGVIRAHVMNPGSELALLFPMPSLPMICIRQSHDLIHCQSGNSTVLLPLAGAWLWSDRSSQIREKPSETNELMLTVQPQSHQKSK
jgi:hypothetical protein